MTKRYVVTATPPTPNGDFHVGHIAGPYLGADLFSRFQRMRGNEVIYVCSSDRNQSYVVTTAERLGNSPETLARNCHQQMIQTLEAAQISLNIFNEPDTAHVEYVQSFFRCIQNSGYIKRQKRPALYSSDERRYLFESYISGYCPTCWSATAGAICETCGHPNDARLIELPTSRTGSTIELVEVDVAVLELERFREQYEAFYLSKRGVWRPHLIEFIEEMLSHPLPDYPLTYPSDWGVPAPFVNFEGQVLNVWAEMLPGLVNSSREAMVSLGRDRDTGIDLWKKEGSAKLVQFLGFDNAFFFTFVHPALFWAAGDFLEPEFIITNEFYELDHFKFSTSKGHLIWARDLFANRDADLVRFYLALSNPEHQKMNFTMATMDMLIEAKFRAPFSAALEKLADAIDRRPEGGEVPLIQGSFAGVLDHALARFAAFHTQRTFSPQRIAEHLSQLLFRIDAGARHLTSEQRPPHDEETAQIEETRRLVSYVGLVLPIVTKPLMPHFSDRLADALGVPKIVEWPDSVCGCEIRLSAAALRRAARSVVATFEFNLKSAS